ncbi:energy transducer TonB [Hymenobacter cellulosivorans]|uniref:Energy transducer TonB n=1 Tax=Hymenobacter cellulosivorans TaxID=2932249 RepID=A0ABY4FDK4_9BACT|nr:energy transducer TonB [Hymenobacter cellulosivorans]UOQ54062.1 energy transducer TonB [Hymenobacter cellulosivorans]
MRPANQPPVPPSSPAPDAAGHLPLPLLRQYVAGALPAAEQYRVEAHTLDCSRCAELLEGLELTNPATTDQALHELRQRLHQRVAREHAPHAGIRAWQAMAAALLLLLVSTALWWGLRRPVASVSESRPIAVQAPAPVSESAPVPAAPEAASASAEVAAVTEPVPDAARSTAAPATGSVARRAAPVARRGRRPVVAAAPLPPPAAADATADQVMAGSVAMQAPVVAAPTQAEPAEMKAAQSRVMMAQKVEVADTAVTQPAAAKAPVAAPEESAKRKAALPPVPVISPQPVGGYTKLREYLRREAMFVPDPPAPQLSGSVRVRFTVKADGTLDNFKVLRGLRRDYDQEAIRILCEGPTWQPGAANGRRADQVVDISVTF